MSVVDVIALLNLYLEVLMNITVDALKQILEDQMPLITLVDGGILYGGIPGFGHFIVIVGIEDQNIIYHDMGKLLSQLCKICLRGK